MSAFSEQSLAKARQWCRQLQHTINAHQNHAAPPGAVRLPVDMAVSDTRTIRKLGSLFDFWVLQAQAEDDRIGDCFFSTGVRKLPASQIEAYAQFPPQEFVDDKQGDAIPRWDSQVRKPIEEHATAVEAVWGELQILGEVERQVNVEGVAVELRPALRKALASFSLAELELEKSNCADRDAYDYLKKHGCELYDESGLPSFSTWSQNLSKARTEAGANKNQPRHGRATGRSIVNASQV